MWFARVHVIYGSGYFTIFITLDRTLNSLYFNRIPFLKKYRNILLVTLGIQVGVVLINLLQWWRYLARPASCLLSSILTTIFSFEAILSRILPSACNMFMNVIIIRALVRSKQAVSTTNQISKKEYYFAISLISHNCFFFLITFPLVVISGIQISLGLKNQTGTPYGQKVAVWFNLASWGSFVYEALSPFWMNLVPSDFLYLSISHFKHLFIIIDL